MASPAATSKPSWPVADVSVAGFHVVAGVHQPSSVLTRHSHDTPTICCVQHGRFTEYYPGKAVDCDRHMLKVTPAGEPHWNHFSTEPTYGLRIDVDDERFQDAPAVRRMLGERLFLAAGTFAELTARLVAELRRRDALSSLAAEGLLLELVARMARATEPGVPPLPPWLRRADDLVRGSFTMPLTVASVAAEVGVRPATLAQGYRRAFGCSIADRVRTLRLDHAAHQLTQMETPIAEIAISAGFYDQSHFSNTFRRHYGSTPAQYRRAGGTIPR